jgi:endoglucanase
MLAWQLMTPTLGGSVDETFFARYNATVQAALSSSPNVYVIADVVGLFVKLYITRTADS